MPILATRGIEAWREVKGTEKGMMRALLRYLLAGYDQCLDQ